MQGTTGQTIGGYTVLREIGRGGMSTVYAAREDRTGETVALKILTLPATLTPEQQRDLIARFGREARAVARLSHPGIVAIRDVGQQGGVHYLAMECLEGQTLRERLAHGALTPAQALPVLRQVAEALDAVHAAGVIHRDVKPTNVMLLPDGRAKLLDFGVARQSDDTTITSTGAIVGSPAYMSPEQIRGESGSAATDVWALGVLLYEMLAGHPPFTASSIPSVLYQVAHEAPPAIAGLTTPVQRVLRRALDKNPLRRYPTARALADALQDALPTPRTDRRFAWPTRPPTRPWLLLLVLVPVLLGTGLVALTHYRTAEPLPPGVPVPISPAPAVVPRPTSPHAAPAVRHPAATRPTHKAHRTTVKAKTAHKPSKPHAHRAAVRRPRVHRPFAHRRIRWHFVRRGYGKHYDPAASARLQQFIYSPQ